MIKFAMKGNAQKQVRSAISSKQLEIKGNFHFSGCQIVGGEGGAPEWVYALFESNPEIVSIAINKENSGIVYAPANK